MVSSHTQNRNLKQNILKEIQESTLKILMDDKKILDSMRISDLRTLQTIMRRLRGDMLEVQENRKEKNYG
jgi:hypothetical protein